MTDMFNTKIFIKEIQGRPCLWNLNVKEYNDKVARLCAWQQIAQIMYKDWEDLDAKEKTGKIRDLQKKWKGLRDYFTREKNKNFTLKSGSGTRKKRKTPFLDMLSFLIVKKKASQALQNHQCSKEMMAETDLENSNTLRTCIQETSQEMEISKEMGTQNNDPDMNFLLSILPDIKSMTAAQNFEFRFQVMTLIKNMKYNQNNPDYYYTAPGASTFTHVSKYTPSMEVEIDHISDESVASSSADIKPTL